jgi:PAS domain S-box-containing protein
VATQASILAAAAGAGVDERARGRPAPGADADTGDARLAADGRGAWALSDAALQALVAHGAATALTDACGVFRYVSPAVTAMLGYEPHELIGRSGAELAHPDDVARLAPLRAQVRGGPGVPFTAEMRYRHRDGTWRWIESTATSLLHDPEVQAVVAHFRDVTDRVRREEAERRRAAQAEALAGVVARVGSAASLDGALEALLRGAVALLGGHSGTIHLLDPQTRERLASFDLRRDGTLISAVPVKPVVPGSFSHAIAAGGPAALVEDFRALGDAYPLQESVARLGLRSSVNVPIRSGARLLGSLHVDHSEPGHFGAGDLALAEALAALAGEAVERAQAEAARREADEGLERLTRRLRLLLDVATRVGPALRLGAPLDGALRTLVEALPETDTAAILLHDPATGELVPRAFVGLGEAYGRIRLRPGEGISGACFERRRSIRGGGHDSVLALRRRLRPENARLLEEAAGVRCFLRSISIPLRTHDGATLGVMTLGSNHAEFSDDDVRLLEGVAAQLALAIQNAQLYENARRELRERAVAERRLRESTERLERAYEELEAAQARLVQQERLKALGQLAAGIAHDLNNTLAPVVGFSDLLRMDTATLTHQQRRWLDLIHAGALDAADVVRRLREFYRPREDGEVFGPVDLGAVVAQTLELTRPRWRDDARAAGRAVEVRAEIAPALPPVRGSGPELREALTNLVLNAVDALPDGGTITIRARTVAAGRRRAGGAAGAVVVLEVADTGAGMPDDVRQRCLEPFFTTKGERGTGLGLAMVHGTVTRHGGTLEIESAPGAGTTVRLRLPAVRTESDESGGHGDSAGDGAGRRALRLLVVDDEDVVRGVTAALLEAEGHTVVQAAGGEEGLAALRDQAFDALVTDRAMPGMNGEQLAAAAKALRPGLPVVLLTGYGTLMAAAGEHPQAVDAVLSKPATLDALRSTIDALTASESV